MKIDVSKIKLSEQPVTVVKLRDVTEYVKKREIWSAEEHKRTKRRRVETAKVAHELRTPLASMRQLFKVLKLLGISETDRKRTKRYLKIMAVQADILSNLINGLLQIEQIERGIHNMRIKMYDPNKIFAFVQKMMQIEAKTKRIKITYKLKPPSGTSMAGVNMVQCGLHQQLPLIEGEPIHLKQILINLVKNAIKFTPAPGEIEIIASFDFTNS